MSCSAIALFLVLLAPLAVSCSSPEEEAASPPAASVEDPAPAPETAPVAAAGAPTERAERVFPVEEGFHYYTGGPIVRMDRYGRPRMYRYVDETTDPPLQGVVIGHKELGDGKFEMTTIVNGDLITRNFGFRDEDGNMWFDRRLGYHGTNKILEMTFIHDDEAEVSTTVRKDFDLKTGELIREVEFRMPYAPPPDEGDGEVVYTKEFVIGEGAEGDEEAPADQEPAATGEAPAE
jgi:hypothetical protein